MKVDIDIIIKINYKATILATVSAAFVFFFGIFLLFSAIHEDTRHLYGWYFGIIGILGLIISVSFPYIVYTKVFDYLDK
jgi:undecaprenyl pyrophosphate phosphatase UppP